MLDVLEPPRILLSSILPTIKRAKPNDAIIPNRVTSNYGKKENNNDIINNMNLRTFHANLENINERDTERKSEERGEESSGEKEGGGGDREDDRGCEEIAGDMIMNFEGL